MGKAPREESSFRNSRPWTPVSRARRWLVSRREARRQAIVRLLDTLQGTPHKKIGA